MLHKRGQTNEVLWWLINLFFLAVILMSILYVINSLLNNNNFEKRYLAKDLALVMNNLHSAPNNVFFVYTENEFDFDVRFEKNKVTVYNPKEGELTGKSYPFIEDEGLKIRYKKIKSSLVDEDKEKNYLLALGFKKTPARINPIAIINTEEVLK
ncbi:MAG: hypothetical protein ABIJ34_00600 [archaeon]